MPESKLTVEAMTDAVRAVLEHPEGAQQMARAALSVGRPDAARELAALVVELAEHNKDKSR